MEYIAHNVEDFTFLDFYPKYANSTFSDILISPVKDLKLPNWLLSSSSLEISIILQLKISGSLGPLCESSPTLRPVRPQESRTHAPNPPCCPPTINSSGVKTNMADTEFEEFRQSFEKLTSHTKKFYTFLLVIVNKKYVFYFFGRLVHDVLIDEDSPTSSKSDIETDCDINGDAADQGASSSAVGKQSEPSSLGTPTPPWSGERRRRKLPEIPKNKKCTYLAQFPGCINAIVT
ncbi:hypothetical protein NQ317_017101 [Molorchus minor]|uniref:Uncharacterized protein n=1 Tax=Molorchus minor TaxID=1323400 RepID=A0ABQ9JQ68_9CUCU|nr:hypothetical protein NQ317_017101 [Molorchus minor]